jgi:ribosomal protein S12 methylthiotransferase accessory factor
VAVAAPPGLEIELQDVDRTPAEETIRRGSRLVSRKVGVIRSVRRSLHKTQEPAIYSLGGELTDLSRYSSLRTPPLSSGGGETLAAALAATIGESAERYCMNFFDAGATVVAPYREVAEDAVSPERARLYSREQIESLGEKSRVEYFTEDTRIRWVWGYSLTDQRPRLVPASLVYIHHPRGDGEAEIGSNASTGLAAGATLEEAILSGLLEIFERDAFILSWLHRRVGARIHVDDPELDELLARRFHARHPSVDLRLFDLTLDFGIPVVMLALKRPAEFGTAFGVTAAARLSPRAAAVKAVHESGQLFTLFRHMLDRDWQPAPDFSNVTDFELHTLLYLRRPELIPEAMSFCDHPGREVALSQMPDLSTGRVLGDLRLCLERLKAGGFEAVVVDLTTPDIRQVGLRVVRVVAPGLVPLHGDHLRYLGVQRIRELPRRLGWDTDAGLNPYPHPFP